MNKRLVAVMQSAIALCVACLAAGCSAGTNSTFDGPVRLSALQELLASSDMERFGSEDGASSLSRILAARLTPDQTRGVILDDAAPFLKVFRRVGELAVAAIERGGGPAELRPAGTMDVLPSGGFDGRPSWLRPGHLVLQDLRAGYVLRSTTDPWPRVVVVPAASVVAAMDVGDQPGSGWPGTYLDVGRAVDHLRSIAPQYALDLDRVVVVGHSAGGHLAMWTAARHRLGKESPLFVNDPLRVRGVVNLAGTMDMADNIARMETTCGDTVVTGMMGGTPAAVPERYADGSAIPKLPLELPQALIWGEYDDFVPLPLAQKYAQIATQAGDSARVIVIPGAGHFEIASPLSSAWPEVRSTIRSLLDGRLPP